MKINYTNFLRTVNLHQDAVNIIKMNYNLFNYNTNEKCSLKEILTIFIMAGMELDKFGVDGLMDQLT